MTLDREIGFVSFGLAGEAQLCECVSEKDASQRWRPQRQESLRSSAPLRSANRMVLYAKVLSTFIRLIC